MMGRFEVFLRSKFRCRLCGNSPPFALTVTHTADKGLIAVCRDCRAILDGALKRR